MSAGIKLMCSAAVCKNNVEFEITPIMVEHIANTHLYVCANYITQLHFAADNDVKAKSAEQPFFLPSAPGDVIWRSTTKDTC